jgi:protein-tyrosine phosphatase
MKQGFIDIHCHLLPGLDDGAACMEDALEMAALAHGDGIEIVIATPHADHQYEALPFAVLESRIQELQTALDQAGNPLRVLPGADVHICESLARKVQDRQIMTLADTGRHLLLELPHEIFFPFDDLLLDLEAIGTQTILSHPERNKGIQADREVLWPLVERGCLMQITAGSILGEFGPTAETLSAEMLAHRLVHFVATDAHSPRKRKPLLSEAWKQVAAMTDQAYADQIFRFHPRAVVRGEPIAVAPPRPQRKSFFARLFGG